jgi:serine/threonine protein kinase
LGAVYRACYLRLGRVVARKMIPANMSCGDVGWGTLLREVRLASTLNHPHICTVFDVGEDEGQAYIVMEYIDGHRLSDLIPQGGFSPGHVLSYGAQIAEALAYMHQHGVIH